ncbi:hypothetical protein VZT92_017875 [Zoarces viviparus]|uniref:Uncharacterized protein n=1 Tax=Zoarces viviparus TaxID=48416 RepID=A0AAW1ERW3_ZOAVI
MANDHGERTTKKRQGDTRTYWKAVNIPSSSSSSHGSILSAGPGQMKERTGGESGMDAPGPTTTKRLRASEKQLLSRSLSPTPLKKGTNPLPLNLFKK